MVSAHEEIPAIERSIWLPAPPRVVWAHLTDGGLASIWFEGRVELRPRLGGRITLELDEGEPRWGTIEEIVAERAIQWTWRTDSSEPSLVRIELEAEEEGTRLRVLEQMIPYEVSFHPRPSPAGWLPMVDLG